MQIFLKLTTYWLFSKQGRQRSETLCGQDNIGQQHSLFVIEQESSKKICRNLQIDQKEFAKETCIT
jgi:hypothetical protein